MLFCRIVMIASTFAMACWLPAQDKPETKLAGVWEAKIHDTVFVVLQVKATSEVSGTLRIGSIHTDADGNLVDAAAAEEEFPMLKPRLENGRLSFEWKDDPSEEPLQLEMILTDGDHADLRFVTTPGDSKIKAFKLTRAKN